ncbi:hypothetical protein CYMTET_41070 [Cymbomonas tetramitiformis]|uniref:Integrase zinc-binding domain-containing protein n=1 Tax=Cymbomonas tetramitiformis TaxID=36881 RepID=A0AAE0F312_9CHLO|nr:hypothetical protein CYMTET_41070 [Cymbomonas tetramitiformis]
MVGRPVSFDAAQAGSYAHRLRAYWSNLFQNDQFNSVMAKVERPDGRRVSDILDKGWQPREVFVSDQAPYYLANVRGEPMRALPTIMATQNSWAFRKSRMGSVLNADGHQPPHREVNLQEKARAMGYSAAELRMTDGVGDLELAEVLGLAMDRRAMELLYAVAEASRRGLPYSPEKSLDDNAQQEPAQRRSEPVAGDQARLHSAAAEWIARSNSYTRELANKGISHEERERTLAQICSCGHKGVHGLGSSNVVQRKKKWQLAYHSLKDYKARHGSMFVKAAPKPAAMVVTPHWVPTPEGKPGKLPRLEETTRLTEMLANVAQQESQRQDYKDIHNDELTLSWLKSRGTLDLPEAEARRVRGRARRHRWDEATDEIYMLTHAGRELRVPKPCDRLQLVKDYHTRTGHWGIRRTLNLLWQRNWWVDMRKDVQAVVTQCETCQALL